MKKIIKSIFIFAFIFWFSLNVFADSSQTLQKIDKNSSSFQNDLFSWIWSYKYEFDFPTWQRWQKPSLSLNYNTANLDYLNDSWYGFNFWVESIFRSTKKWVDKLYSLDEFAINSSFSYNELVKTWTWIFSWVNNNDLSKYNFSNDNWIVKDTSWNTYYFWEWNETKQINPENSKTFRWVLSKKVDNFWNEIRYSYTKANNNIYLSEINYAFKNWLNPLYKIKINYLEKTFSTQSYIYAFKLENYKLIKSVVLETLVNWSYEETKKYELNYTDPNTIFPKLLEIKESAWNVVKNITSFEYYNSGLWINLVSKINNWKWLITTLEYKASSLYKNTTVPFLLKTLYKITYKDTTTNLEYSNTYDYYWGNFYFDPANIYNRWYTWFKKVKILEDDWSYKYIYFHQSDSDKENNSDSLNGEFEDHISKKWKIYREEEYDKDWKIYTSKITKWIKVNKWNNIYFVMPERITNILWNKVWNHIDSSETFEYDSFWNVTKNTKYAEVTANVSTWDFTDIKSDKRVYEYTYASDSNNLFLNEVCEEKRFDNNWNQISLSKYFYDDLWDCEVENLLLTKKSIFYSEENRFLNQNFTYQNWVLKTESDFLWNITTYNYDDYNLLVTSQKNPKNWQESYVYDYKIQKPTSIIDVNWINYKFYYDNFWNLTKKSVINPSDNSEITLEENIINYSSFPNYLENKKYNSTNSFITTRVYFDWFSREIETKVSSKYPDKFSTTKIKYDKNWNKEFITYPRFENNLNFTSIENTEKWNILTFDTLGRILTQTNKTWTTSLEYDLLKTTHTNQKWVKKDFVNDIFWNLVEVKEYNWSENYTTNYEYNVLNKLSKITDSKWNIRNFYYDSLARITKQEDLHNVNSTNFWSVEYSYNDNSLVTSKKSMSWDIIHYTYDNLWRITNESFWSESNDFIYDVWSFAKWKLTKTSKNNYSEEYKYNFLWQKVEDKKIYSDSDYTLKYEFDTLWNLKKITYPDNKETNYVYENGYVNKVNYDWIEILSNIEYEANNKSKKQVFANWLTNEETFDYEYWYRLVSKKAFSWSLFYQNINYTFDNVWNISTIIDSSNLWIQKNSSYTYDDLSRLLNFQITDSNNISNNITFSYDSIWNILSNSLVWNYSYDNSINPHAVSSFGSWNIIFYDSNWNVNFETINWINKTYNYNPKQELLSSVISELNTSYLYDNNSNRVSKNSSSGSWNTLIKYLNNDFEIENNCHSELVSESWSTSIVCETKTSKYIYLWDKKIFTIENKDNSQIIVYNFSDHLSGAWIDVSHNWTVLQKSDYFPYGWSRVIERNENYKNRYLFTWKELDDESGLQYFEARYYNPDIWRFYGQDRVFWELGNTKRWISVLSDPQQLNSYSYARNNPVIYVDPSGEKIELVARKLDMNWWEIWVHTYIRITETIYSEEEWICKEKITTIWAYNEDWKLVNRINDNSDKDITNYKEIKNIEIPNWMTEQEFIERLLDANIEYNWDRAYNTFWNNGYYNWNCNNFTSSILEKSWYDLNNLKNFNPSWANPWLWYSFRKRSNLEIIFDGINY